MGPKYEFTGETMKYNGHLLHQIRRLSDNLLGGWIESEENLSQEGDCWVDSKTKVYMNAKVYDNAQVYGYAHIFDNVSVYGNAQVYDNAVVCGHAKVYGNAKVYDDAWVNDNTKVYDNAQVYGNALVSGNAEVYGNANVAEVAKVYGNAQVYGYALVYGNAEVYGNAKIHGDARIHDNAKVYGNIQVIVSELTGKKYDKDLQNKDSSKEIIQDFIYKVNDSNKIVTQIEYDSVDEFFNAPITNDIKLDTLVICAVDTKESLIKLQKIETDNKTEFKFIVDIINEDGDNFMFKSIIKSQEQLNELIQQTIEALKLYPKFSKYVNDLENCL